MAFSYYKSITLDASQAGTADSTDWPLTIALDGRVQTADADLKTVANGGFVTSASGYDIRPYSDSGLTSALTFELVFYEASSGKLEMHVKIPTLSHSSNTVIYLAFGDAGVTTDGSSTGAWNSAFVGVYHLKDGSTLSVADSTSNANNGTNNGATATAGAIDGGAHFTKASSQYIDGSNGTALRITGSITIEAWFLLDSINAGNFYGIATKDASGQRAYDLLATAASGNPLRFWINGGGTAANDITGATSLSSATWYYAAGVYDTSGRTMDIYLNATADHAQLTSADTSISASTAHLNIGGWDFNSALYMDGKIDEVRISNVARSSSWITATYKAQKASSNFIAWGTKTSVGGGGGLPFFMQSDLLNGGMSGLGGGMQ